MLHEVFPVLVEDEHKNKHDECNDDDGKYIYFAAGNYDPGDIEKRCQCKKPGYFFMIFLSREKSDKDKDHGHSKHDEDEPPCKREKKTSRHIRKWKDLSEICDAAS